MIKLHWCIDILLILFLCTIIYDTWKQRRSIEFVRAYHLSSKNSLKFKLLSYFLILCSSVDLLFYFLGKDFSLSLILDKILLLTVFVTIFYIIPKKVYITDWGICYFNKNWHWKDIRTISIYGNVLDILFEDYSRKLICLEQPTLQEEQEMLKIFYKNNAVI